MNLLQLLAEALTNEGRKPDPRHEQLEQEVRDRLRRFAEEASNEFSKDCQRQDICEVCAEVELFTQILTKVFFIYDYIDKDGNYSAARVQGLLNPVINDALRRAMELVKEQDAEVAEAIRESRHSEKH